MASPEVRILGSWQSPYALRARVALNIKSVPYELQQEQVLVAKSDLLLKLNPIYKKIPVLIHNDMSLCESLVIVQYIDQVWASGPAILPSDPYDRAVARFWTNYIDVKEALKETTDNEGLNNEEHVPPDEAPSSAREEKKKAHKKKEEKSLEMKKIKSRRPEAATQQDC